ncbi:N-acetyl-gamma-glutamyl-phosphate reductase [compost metagenome]
MIKAGIIGGTGYTAGELIRILRYHSQVEIAFVYSQSKAGESISSVHEDLFDCQPETFTDLIQADVNVVFLCLGHGNSTAFLKQHAFSEQTVIIDLSNDFRLKNDANFNGKSFTYGLPEVHKTAIRNAKHIANPGCFATSIQLALAPLAKAQLLHSDVHIHGITGSTGAGASLSDTAHFSWRNNNLSVYKAMTHQHLGEIAEQVNALQVSFNQTLNFVPLRGNFTRGILVTLYTETALSESELVELFTHYYQHEPFVKISTQPIHLKQVVNTNYALLQVQKMDGKVLVTSVIDNLLKGASGQAVQNMNLMFGFEETTGLQLKANFF